MGSVFKEFRDFIMRGNVIDLAVAVIIGAAFTGVVTSFSNDILMQVIAGIFGKPSYGDLTWTLGSVVIHYGKFLTAVVNFLIVAFVLFLVVKTMNSMAALAERRRKAQESEAVPAAPTELEILADIRDLLRSERG